MQRDDQEGFGVTSYFTHEAVHKARASEKRSRNRVWRMHPVEYQLAHVNFLLVCDAHNHSDVQNDCLKNQ
jgi:hypothetical protein